MEQLQIQIVYSPDVETDETLSKFLTILNRANILDNFSFIPISKYLQNLESSSSVNFFTLALGDTFETISLVFQNKLSLPPFEFTSKKYYDPVKNILFYNIPLTVTQMFEKERRIIVWDIIQKFKEYYIVSYEKVNQNILKSPTLEHEITFSNTEQVSNSEDLPSLQQSLIELSELMSDFSNKLINLSKILTLKNYDNKF